MTLEERLRALAQKVDDNIVPSWPIELCDLSSDLRTLADEIKGKVLVKPFTVFDVPSGQWVAKIDHTYPGYCTATDNIEAEAIAALQVKLSHL